MESIVVNTCNYIIVDNNSLNIEQLIDLYPNNIISLNENLGIASAQNIGIKYAKENNADYVWLSDQDTIYPDNYIESTSILIQDLLSSNKEFAVIGPSFIERNRNKIQPFIQFSPFSKKIYANSELINASQLIASGMVIPINMFSIIGYKNEDLFIDWVDLEWCWRASKKGYYIIGNGKVVIEHTLGDEMIPVFGKLISIRSPFRHYFIIRNGIYLALYSKDINIYMKSEIFIKSLIWLIVYPMLAKENKLQHLKATFLGLYHGIFAKLGSFKQ